MFMMMMMMMMMMKYSGISLTHIFDKKCRLFDEFT